MKKKLAATILVILPAFYSYSQNIFPNSGNVGIGTTNPQSLLDVVGEIRSTNSGSNLYWAYMKSNWAQDNVFELDLSGHKLLTSDNYYYGSALNFWTADAKRMTINSNGDVGIGTTTPSYKLHVIGTQSNNWNGLITSTNGQGVYFAHGSGYGMHVDAGTNASAGTYVLEAYSNYQPRFYVRGDGNVGIGTNAPECRLHVAGTLAGWNGLVTAPNGQGVYFSHGGGYGMHVNAGTNASTSTYIFEAYSNNQTRFYIRGDGKVGIGTSTPAEMLSVNGKIRAKEIKVEAAPWPDYVFESSYKLPDLKLTEQFIKENKHLPEIPSEAEVKKNGIELGEMNALLLKKIEELTLYMIQKDKEVKELKARLDILEKKE